MKRVAAVVLSLALITFGLSACNAHDSDDLNDGAAVPGTVAPSDASTSTAADPVSPTDAAGAESDDSPDADAIMKELEAIQQELDGTTLPDDSDFSDIESGL